MEDFDRQVQLQVYRHFVDAGHPPVPAEIAQALGSSPVDVEAALRRLAEQRVLVLAPGTPYVWMANPLSAIPTPFRVEAGGRRWWGNCIWDALGVVAMLGRDGQVSTWCPDCGEPLVVPVEAGSVPESSEVVHFAVPAAHWWDDLGFN